MQYYFAPLEGLTDFTYRRLHRQYFPGVDRYYTPFFSPTVHRQLTPREAKELPPADQLDAVVIPQLLTKVAEDFTWMAQQCADRGYSEVNLNLGCPSGTVTAKGKGSGMLRQPEELDRFLDTIFRDAPLPISVKTRIGFSSADEWPALLEIYNRYPICELTIHPRVRTAFYAGEADLDAFAYAVNNTKIPLCYNGDLRTGQQIQNIRNRFPQVDAMMVGRGLIANPGMFTPGGTSVSQLQAFYDHLEREYVEAFGGPRNAMFRLKEHWGMLQHNFIGGEKLFKQLRKTTDLAQYRSITAQIFQTLDFQNEKIPE